jgi:hypothetical protein
MFHLTGSLYPIQNSPPLSLVCITDVKQHGAWSHRPRQRELMGTKVSGKPETISTSSSHSPFQTQTVELELYGHILRS